ncbi:SDR family NAD(P)-dependent oxidoreductase [Mycobacterium basiliense]|nr:SDR family NAD(P)-dependent oxidoreductase [Mycobacterium basiliense]
MASDLGNKTSDLRNKAYDLRGKAAVVTGGAGGIGLAMGRRFGQEGMAVVLADVLAAPLQQATRALAGEGIEVAGVVTDVTDYSSVESLAKEVLHRFGAVHVVCNNAGTGGVSEGYMWEHDLADWRWGIDVNVLGVVHGIKAFVPILLKQGEGHVVNTCSGNGGFAPIARGATGGPAMAVYPMTKAAVLCLTESLYTHLEMTGTRVRAHVLFPSGFLNTGIWESWRHRPERYAATQERRTPEQTLAAVLSRFEAAGGRVEFTPLETVADQVVAGIQADRFWMMGPPSPAEEVVTRKAASIRARSDPDYLVDVLGRSTAREPETEGGKR